METKEINGKFYQRKKFRGITELRWVEVEAPKEDKPKKKTKRTKKED